MIYPGYARRTSRDSEAHTCFQGPSLRSERRVRHIPQGGGSNPVTLHERKLDCSSLALLAMTTRRRPAGQIALRPNCLASDRHRPCSVITATKVLAPKNSFQKHIQSVLRAALSASKNSTFFFTEMTLSSVHPASHEGRFAIVTGVECGMRWARRVAA